MILDHRPNPGPTAQRTGMLIVCNCLIPQLLWFKSFRTNPVLLWIVSIVVNIGMWLERFVIVVISLHRDFLPSSWGMYHGTFWDYATFYGTIGLFLTLIFLFIRVLPVISISEMRELVHETRHVGPRPGRPAPEGRMAPRHEHHARRRQPGLRPDGRVHSRPRRSSRPPEVAYERVTGRWTPTRRSRSTAWPRRSASRRTGCPLVVLIGGLMRRPRRLPHAVVLGGDPLPDQHRRPAAR